jgi:ribA/ribD-fused uncharacterized protein
VIRPLRTFDVDHPWRAGHGAVHDRRRELAAVPDALTPFLVHDVLVTARLVRGGTADQIRQAPHPGAAKRLDRQVADFDEQEWAWRRFGGHRQPRQVQPASGLLDLLLATGGKVLVEAAPNDRIWDIGLAATDERAGLPERWPGLNQLGYALMEVRHQLAARERQR